MKITIEIQGTNYTFEMNRNTYKMLLSDEEYAKMQNEITKRIIERKNEGSIDEVTAQMVNDDVSRTILQNLIMEEAIFHYSLLANHPSMTKEDSVALLDMAIAEYGNEEVTALTQKLIANFTQSEDKPKKKMKMVIS